MVIFHSYVKLPEGNGRLVASMCADGNGTIGTNTWLHNASHINLAHSSDVWPSWSYSYYRYIRYMLGEKHISWLRVPCWQLLVLQEASTTSWGGTACISVLDASNIRVISSAEEGNCDQLCIIILYAEFCWLCYVIPLKLPYSLQPAAVWIAIRTPKLNRHLSTCTHSCPNEYVTEVSSLYSRFAVNPSPVQTPPKPMYIQFIIWVCLKIIGCPKTQWIIIIFQIKLYSHTLGFKYRCLSYFGLFWTKVFCWLSGQDLKKELVGLEGLRDSLGPRSRFFQKMKPFETWGEKQVAMRHMTWTDHFPWLPIGWGKDL